MLRLLILLLLPVTLLSQQGIHFENGMTWKQILAKAKKEHKYIFVDCYATWCQPCKYMDVNVYTNDTVGAVMNEKFISVKLQVDTTAEDNHEIVQWYGSAHKMQERYHVVSLPTYLFFSPDGEVLHKDIGLKGKKEFIKLAGIATDSFQQYYRLMNLYKKETLADTLQPGLAILARRVGEENATAIARGFISKMPGLPEAQLYSKKVIDFAFKFPEFILANQFIFHWLADHKRKIDSAYQFPGITDFTLEQVFSMNKIAPFLNKAKQQGITPAWLVLFDSISVQYGEEWADRSILTAKIWWFKEDKNWKEYIKCLDQQVDRYPYRDPLLFNNSAYEVYKYSDDSAELAKAVLWVDRCILTIGKSVGFVLDTKANLLFKLGRKKEGIELEARALQLAKGTPYEKEISDNYAKMNKVYEAKPEQ